MAPSTKARRYVAAAVLLAAFGIGRATTHPSATAAATPQRIAATTRPNAQAPAVRHPARPIVRLHLDCGRFEFTEDTAAAVELSDYWHHGRYIDATYRCVRF